MKSFTMLGALAGLLILATPASQAQQLHNASWQSQIHTGDMPELLGNLRNLTDQAEHDKTASPIFLADLRAMTAAYEDRMRWPRKLLFDDFHDGETANNPAWTVITGDWRVDNRGGTPALTSRARGNGHWQNNGQYGQNNDYGQNSGQYGQNNNYGQNNGQNGQNNDQYGQNNGQQSNSGNSADQLANALNALMGQQNGQGQGQGQQNQQNRDGPATIVVPVAISDQFFVRLVMTSRGGDGEFNFGPYAGRHAENSYQLTYAPGDANGLTLSRVSDRGSRVLGMSRGPIRLEDNQSHLLEWKRGPGGKMIVMLDGRTVIEASDMQIRKPFTGFLMVNSGGTYAVQSVSIDGNNQ
jgi:hypothetical protein